MAYWWEVYVNAGANGQNMTPTGTESEQARPVAERTVNCEQNVLESYGFPPNNQRLGALCGSHIGRLVRSRIAAGVFWEETCVLNENAHYVGNKDATVSYTGTVQTIVSWQSPTMNLGLII